MENLDRRNFVKASALSLGAATLPKFSFANVNASDKIKVAIVGAGRGGEIVAKNMMRADSNISIIALADIFEDKAKLLHAKLIEFSAKEFAGNADIYKVKDENLFSGWDAYKAAVSTDADVIAFATPPVFRPLEARVAISANKHVFLDKPACVDTSGAQILYALAKEAKEKKLTAIAGTQRRYHGGYQEAVKRVQDGQIGDILGAQCYWMFPSYGAGQIFSPELDADEMEFQLRNWQNFIWTSGDQIVEQQVHSIDVINWIFAEEPKEVMGLGGRACNLTDKKLGNRFSHFCVDYEYPSKGRFQAICRQEAKTADYILERVVGTKGVLETNLFGAQKILGQNSWEAKGDFGDGRITQFKAMFESIRNGLAKNEIASLADSTMLAIAGRMSAYSGKKFKYQWVTKRSKESLIAAELKFGKNPVAPTPIAGEYQLT